MLEDLIGLAEEILQQKDVLVKLKEKAGVTIQEELVGELEKLYVQKQEELLTSPDTIKAFEPDLFTDGKYQIIKEDEWAFLRKPTNHRILDNASFIDKFPLVAGEIAKIPLEKAEFKVGKEEVDKLCKVEVTYRYELLKLSDRKKTKTKKQPKITNLTETPLIKV